MNLSTRGICRQTLTRCAMILPYVGLLSQQLHGQACSTCQGGSLVKLEVSFENGFHEIHMERGEQKGRELEVEMRPETEYSFSLDLISSGSAKESSANKVLFGCGVEYRANYIALPGDPPQSTQGGWTKGSVPLAIHSKDANPDPNIDDFQLDVASFDVRITKKEQDEKGDTSSEGEGTSSDGGSGDGASAPTSGPGYSLGSGSSYQLKEPGISIQIPLGWIGMGADGGAPYRSSGMLSNYGPVSAARSAPVNLGYYGIEEVMGRAAVGSLPALPAKVQWQDYQAGVGAAMERVLITPTKVFRVTGFNGSTPGTAVNYATAANTQVREYDRATGQDHVAAMAGPVVSWWQISYASDVLTLVESIRGEVNTRTYASNSAGQELLSTRGATTKQTLVSPFNSTNNTYVEIHVETRDGVAVSRTENTYEMVGTQARLLSAAKFADPNPQNPTGRHETKYDYYDADNLARGVTAGDLRWVKFPDGSWEYYDNRNGGVWTYRPFMSETLLDESKDGDDEFPVKPAAGTPLEGGSGRVRITAKDGQEFVTSLEYWDDEEGDYPGPNSEEEDIVVVEGPTTTVRSASEVSEYTDDGEVLWLGDKNKDDFEIGFSYQVQNSIAGGTVTLLGQTFPKNDVRWLAGQPVLTVQDKQHATRYEYQKSGNLITKTETTGLASIDPLAGGVEIGGEDVFFRIVAGVSEQTVRTYGPEGLVSTEHRFHTGSGFTTAYTDVEVRGENFSATVRNGVEIRRTEETAPGTTVETDAEGLSTTTVRNALGEVVSVTEAAGGGVPARTTTSTTTGATTVTQLNGVTTGSTTIDGLSRVKVQVDENGAVTSTSYEDGGRTTITSRNTVTKETETYLDGRVKSVSGSGVIEEFYVYDAEIDSGVVEWTHAAKGSATALTARQVTRGFDTRGREALVKRKAPSPTGGEVDLLQTNIYASGAGDRLVSVESNEAGSTTILRRELMTADPAAVPSDAELMGAFRISGLDANNSGTLTFGSADRFTTQGWSYVVQDDVVFRQTLSNVYPDGTEAGKQTTTALQSIGFISAASGYAEISKTIHPSGRSSTVTRTVNPAAAIVTVAEDDSATTGVDSVSTSVMGHVQKVEKALGGSGKAETYGYDALGRVTRFTDLRGASTWSFHYNSSFQLEKVVNHLGETTEYDYYPSTHANAGMLWKVTRPGGSVVETSYSTRGETTGVAGTGTYPQAWAYTTYGDRESLTTYRDSSNPTVTKWTYYSGTGLLASKKYNEGLSGSTQDLAYRYEWDGKLSKRTTAGGVITDYVYASSTRDLTAVNYSGSGEGNRTPDVVFSNHDHLGRPGSVEETLAAVSGVNAAETRTRTLSYQPHSGAVSTQYDASHPWLPGVSVEQAADDGQGRPAGFQVKKGGVAQSGQSYAYDSLSRLTTVGSGDFSAALGYLAGTDTLQSVTVNETGGNQTVLQATRSIDMLGRILGVVNKAPGSGLGTSLVTVSSVGYTHDSAGLRDEARREDGTWWDYSYNDRSEVTGAVKKTSGGAGVPGQSYGYAYDGIGNRTSATYGTAPNVSTLNYTANNLNQYTSVSHPGTFDLLVRASSDVTVTATNATEQAKTNQGNLYGIRMSSTNSGAGKLATTTVALQSDVTKTAVAKTWVPKAAESRTYTADGNLASDSRWTYTWDGENRLVKMTPNTTGGAPDITLWYSYDHTGRRIGRKVEDKRTSPTVTTITGYACDDWNVAAEFEASATGTTQPAASAMVLKRSHVWGLDLGSKGTTTPGRENFHEGGGVGGLLSSTWHDGATKRHYLPGYDGNGNIISWMSGTGELLKRLDYDAFGNPVLEENLASVGSVGLLASLPSYGFSTKPTQEGSGLLYYGYRYYDPVAGRWASKDPIEERGGVNLYGFVQNHPIDMIDVLGAAYVSSFRSAELNIPSIVYGETASFGGVNSFWIKVEGDGEFDSKLNSWVFRGMPTSTSGSSTRTWWSSSITHTSGVTIWTDRSGDCPVECAFYEQHRAFESQLGPIKLPDWLPIPPPMEWEEKLWVEICADGTARKGNFTKKLTSLKGASMLSVSHK